MAAKKLAQQPEPMSEASASASASAPAEVAPLGMVRCRVHTGWYQSDRLYATGEEVMVEVEELEKLAHCLAPI